MEKKLTLKESNEVVETKVETLVEDKKEEQELPAVELEEPLTVSEEEITPEEVVKEPVQPAVDQKFINTALYNMLNKALQDKFTELDDLKSMIATIEYESNNDEVISILNIIVDEDSMHTGMLSKALELVAPEEAAGMKAGIEKAEEIISEPATTDLDKKEEPEEEKVEDEVEDKEETKESLTEEQKEMLEFYRKNASLLPDEEIDLENLDKYASEKMSFQYGIPLRLIKEELNKLIK